jgi:hypothetical protein
MASESWHLMMLNVPGIPSEDIFISKSQPEGKIIITLQMKQGTTPLTFAIKTIAKPNGGTMPGRLCQVGSSHSN